VVEVLAVVSVIETADAKVPTPVTLSVSCRVVAPVTSRIPPKYVESETPRPPCTCRAPVVEFVASEVLENETVPTKVEVSLKVVAALKVEMPDTVRSEDRVDTPVTLRVPDTLVDVPPRSVEPATLRFPNPDERVSYPGRMVKSPYVMLPRLDDIFENYLD
jgi:hypothetical protein